MRFTLKTDERGFNAIELLAVIAIMGIMAAIMVPGYAKNRNAKALSYAKTQLSNDIRFVQNYTLSTRRFPNGDAPTGGFGVHFTTGSSYIIFGDKSAAGKPNQTYDGTGELFETVKLVDGIRITDLKLKVGAVESHPTNVDFVSLPPYGKIFLNKNTGDNVELTITYTNGASATGTVTLTGSGLIK